MENKSNINKKTLVLVIMLILMLVVASVYKLKNEKGVNKPLPKYKDILVRDNGLANAVERIYDATVMIKTYQGGKMLGNGSGFIYKKDKDYAYILTNHHVIEKASSLRVKMTTSEVDAKIMGSDKYLDIAVVRIPSKDVIQVASLGKASDLKLGDLIFTIGTPVGGEFFNSVTSGIISAKNREIPISVETKNDFLINVIQTDASINPGNSGGPRVNNKGEVVGINSLKLVDAQIEGMGFAIKIEDALAHAKEFEEGKKIRRPVLGVMITNVENKDLIDKDFNISPKITKGVLITEVDSKSGAFKAGLKEGDVITKIADASVENIAHLKYLLYQYKPGDKVKLEVYRGIIKKTIEVELQEAK